MFPKLVIYSKFWISCVTLHEKVTIHTAMSIIVCSENVQLVVALEVVYGPKDVKISKFHGNCVKRAFKSRFVLVLLHVGTYRTTRILYCVRLISL